MLAKIYTLPSKVADEVMMQENMVPSKSAKLNSAPIAKAGLNTTPWVFCYNYHIQLNKT